MADAASTAAAEKVPVTASGSTLHLHKPDQKCLESFRYLEANPGKNVRGLLIDAFQYWLKIPDDKVATIKEIVRQLHIASLMVDDIEDNSKMRRGQPAAHIIYGVPVVMNTANYVYFLALEKTTQLMEVNKGAMKVFTEEILCLHRGQGQDILWRENLDCPTVEQYQDMVLDKTGGLFRLATRLMQVFSTNTTDYLPLVNNLALYFQIRDDYVNLVSLEYMMGKSFCEDLTEGKFSYPIIHCIKTMGAGDTTLVQILKKRTEDVEVKKFAVRLMHKKGSFRYTYNVLQRLYHDITKQLRELGGHKALQGLMEGLHSQVENADDTHDEPDTDTRAACETSLPSPRAPTPKLGGLLIKRSISIDSAH